MPLEIQSVYSAKRKPQACEVSVIVPSYNSQQTIRVCLKSLLSQHTSLGYEIIIVDSSDDNTAELVKHEFPDVKLFHFEQRVHCGVARNIGVERAKGDIILFVDTDCIVPRNWVEKMVTAFRKYNVDGLCGTLKNGTPWSIIGTTGFYLEFFRFLGPKGRVRPTPYLIGANSAYRKNLFANTKFPNLKLGEDFCFSWRLRNAGARFIFVPSIAVKHINKTGLRRVLKYQFTLGKFATVYRWQSSPTIMRIITVCPVLVIFIPPVILIWIGSIVTRRCSIGDACRFFLSVPLLLSGNYVWAYGFLRGIFELSPLPKNHFS